MWWDYILNDKKLIYLFINLFKVYNFSYLFRLAIHDNQNLYYYDYLTFYYYSKN